MNLNIIKDFFIKYNIKKSLTESSLKESNAFVKTVGLLIDETYFFEKEDLLADLVAIGIKKEQITLLIFRDRLKKNNPILVDSFQYSDINWIGNFDNPKVEHFIQTQFDMLISFYDTEKMPLLQVTSLSKAQFKVGFTNIDKRLNHFMIHTNAENHKVFVTELYKYLKILNKI
jgi:hypothetical protein